MDLLIYGAGGLGKELYDVASRNNSNKWKNILYIDDGVPEEDYYNSKILHWDTMTKHYQPEEVEIIVAVGEPRTRGVLFDKIKRYGYRLTTLIDRTAIVSPSAIIKEGAIILEMSTIHANVVISENVLIQPMVVLGHDIEIGRNSVISAYSSPGGHTVFGERSYLGMHATVKEGLKIGDDAIIGMGAVVIKDVEAYSTVVGNPARVTKGNDEHRVFINSRGGNNDQ